MNKIMFNDFFGLTEAVLAGRKTMTRRICKEQVWSHSDIVNAENGIFHFEIPRYKVGQVVAIAQKYSDVAQEGYPVDSRYDAFRTANWGEGKDGVLKSSAGWSNKLFVKSDLMPHHIRITDVKVERLQDISDEDCIKEGVETMESYAIRANGTKKILNYYRLAYRCKSGRVLTLSGSTPREVYAALIDRISGKGTWKSNPWVFAYEFELVD